MQRVVALVAVQRGRCRQARTPTSSPASAAIVFGPSVPVMSSLPPEGVVPGGGGGAITGAAVSTTSLPSPPA